MNGDKERLRKAIFGKLRTLHRKLINQGIPCNYARSVLSHDDAEIGFKITWEASNNGHMTLLPRLSLRTGSLVETFDETNFELGLARLREAFGTGHKDVGEDSVPTMSAGCG
jgi:hypothetical protein